MSANVCRVKRSFKPYQNVKDTRLKKVKNHVTCIVQKISMKILSASYPPFLSSNSKILTAFLKTFHTKMKPTKCPAKEKKNEETKANKKGRRESEN